jgi:hypothetical protein
MTQAKFIKLLEEKAYSYELKEGKLIVTYKGDVYLNGLTKNITFNNWGDVFLSGLTELPDNITFNNGGHVFLSGLTKLPDNITFNNKGHVFLSGLTKLPDNITFNNKGSVYLDGLTTLPDNITFNNQGGVWLPHLIIMPKNITFNNGGYVDLFSLTPNAIEAGKHKRDIHCWRHKTKGLVCGLGCFVGTREQAIEAIKNNYTDIEAREAYISKVNEAFADYLSKATNLLTK